MVIDALDEVKEAEEHAETEIVVTGLALRARKVVRELDPAVRGTSLEDPKRLQRQAGAACVDPDEEIVVSPFDAQRSGLVDEPLPRSEGQRDDGAVAVVGIGEAGRHGNHVVIRGDSKSGGETLPVGVEAPDPFARRRDPALRQASEQASEHAELGKEGGQPIPQQTGGELDVSRVPGTNRRRIVIAKKIGNVPQFSERAEGERQRGRGVIGQRLEKGVLGLAERFGGESRTARGPFIFSKRLPRIFHERRQGLGEKIGIAEIAVRRTQ